MVERLKRLYLTGKINEQAVRNAVTQGLITASDASYILATNKT